DERDRGRRACLRERRELPAGGPARGRSRRFGALMAALDDLELEFLRTQRIGRLATVGPSGQPHVMPVMYQLREDGSLEFDADGIKLRNLTEEPRVALVVDSMGPRRGVAIQGRATVVGHERARLEPWRSYSWGLQRSASSLSGSWWEPVAAASP